MKLEPAAPEAAQPAGAVALPEGLPAAEAISRPCLNCGFAGLPAGARYCPQCGQEVRTRTPSVGEFLREFVGNYLALEGALWRTLRLLLLQPGALTREYLAGRRRHYVRPLRLYLSISLLVLLGMSAMTKTALDAVGPVSFDRKLTNFTVVDIGMVRAGLDRGQFFCKGLPAAYCRRLEQTLLLDPAAIWRQTQLSVQRLVSNLGTAMFLLVPAFAALLRLAFVGQRWCYAEHLVFALHLHAFWFLALALALAANAVPVLGSAAWLLLPVYGLWAARQVYGGKWSLLLLRLAAVGVLYLGLLLAALVVMLLWAFVA